MTIPYYPLSDEMIGQIARLQLERIRKRIAANHRIKFSYDDDVVRLITTRCTEVESGGRMIDAILTNTMLPRISRELLSARSTASRFPIFVCTLKTANSPISWTDLFSRQGTNSQPVFRLFDFQNFVHCAATRQLDSFVFVQRVLACRQIDSYM